MAQPQHVPDTDPVARTPASVRVAGLLLRALFILVLVAVTIRVSLPQSETIWTAYDTPNDLIRLALGLGVCIWLVIQLFRTPVDAAGYRTWLYVGLAGIPFAVICLVYIW